MRPCRRRPTPTVPTAPQGGRAARPGAGPLRRHRALRLAFRVLVTPDPAHAPLLRICAGERRPTAEWARARCRGRVGALGPGLAAGRRPLTSMRRKAAGWAERRPLQPRTEAAAAPAGRGTWRSPLLGVAGARGLGAAAATCLCPARLGAAFPPRTPRAASRARHPQASPAGAQAKGRGPRPCGPGRGARAGVEAVEGGADRRLSGPAAVALSLPLSAAAWDLIHCWKLRS